MPRIAAWYLDAMWVAPIAFVAGMGIVLVALAHGRSRRGPPDPRERERRWMVVTALLTVPMGPAVLLHLDRRLPAVAPDHWQEGIWGVWQGSSGDTWYAIGAILLLIRAAVPLLGWYAAAVSAYLAASRQLLGLRAARMSAAVFAVVALVATSRIARGGVPPEAFTELGHLTPGLVAGTDVDATLADHAIARVQAQPAEPILPSPSAPPEPSRGLPGPLRLFDVGFVLCWYACDRPEPRARYLAGWDTWRPARDGHVLLARVREGRTEAMLVEDVSFEPVALVRRDVWRLLRPPAWPLATATVIAGVAVALRRRHLACAWLFSEATAIVVFAYATFVGM